MAEVPLRQATTGRDISIEFLPFELRPYPHPTLRPEDSYLQSAWANSVYPLARNMGVTMRLPSVSPQPYTRMAHEGLEVAREFGKSNAYAHGVFVAFFQKSEDIGSIDVLSRVAFEIGLDAAAFRSALEEGRYADRTAELLRNTREQMVNAVPTLVIGRRRLSGLHSSEVLARIIEEEFSAHGTNSAAGEDN